MKDLIDAENKQMSKNMSFIFNLSPITNYYFSKVDFRLLFYTQENQEYILQKSHTSSI